MALTRGARLGPYEILSPIGAGGMGEVYRARDTKLDRDVALKILPEAFASNPERLARFEREAKTLAALNDPHIAHIHGLEESDGVRALVLEFVDGPTLADRIAQGPVPINEALTIARQIAQALEAAHEQGIIHRDLKPANIKVREDGTVKVLDFGLAKALDPLPTSSPSATNSPTIMTPAMMTGVGMILGTAAYMAPEQARGKVVDKRADIWGFGCVVFEMLTGRRPFEGELISDVLASVLKMDPNWQALSVDTPAALQRLLRRCLDKDPRRRLQAIGEARVQIDDLLDEGSTDAPSAAATVAATAPARISPRLLAIAGVTLAAGLAISAAVAWRLKPEQVRNVTRFSVQLPEGQRFTGTGRLLATLSPDGTNLVYVANQRLWLRSMSTLETRAIAGTEDTGYSPAFSPDGQSLVFASVADGTLKRVALTGGAPVTICPISTLFGLSWDEDGILFGQAGKGILRVSPNPGVPEVVAAVKVEELASSPQMLPGGKAVLFSIRKTSEVWDKGQVVVQTLRTGARKTLVDGGADGRYVPTGHLVYAVSGVLLAVPFDLDRLAVSGGPVPVVEGVRRAGTSNAATAQFAFSGTGTLAFLAGPAKTSSTGDQDLAIFDSKGGAERLKLPPGSYRSPRVSPDGKSVVFETEDDQDAIVWVYDLGGGSQAKHLTLGGKNRAPIWSADSQWIAFQSDRESDLAIFRQRADGSGTAERLTKPEAGTNHTPQSWSSDGAHLLFTVQKDQQFTLWTMDLKDRRTIAFGDVLSVVPTESGFSPNGRWIVYQSRDTMNQAGTQVFVQPFPSTGAKYLVPQTGGHPYWSRKGDELILNVTPTQSISVAVTTTPTVMFGRPAEFSRVGRAEPNPAINRRGADAMPDGQHVIGVTSAGQVDSGPGQASQITVVLSWFEELKARVPTK